MSYYNKYKNFKPWLSLAVALIFWASSLIFFMVGMSFDTELVVFGKNIIVYVSIALALANTIIQVAGNGNDNMDTIDWVIWMASYALGIGTNVYGLTLVLNMNNPNLEWIVSISLGIIIEVSPERQLVTWLKNWKPAQTKRQAPQKSTYRPKHKPAHLGRKQAPAEMPGLRVSDFENMPDWAKNLKETK